MYWTTHIYIMSPTLIWYSKINHKATITPPPPSFSFLINYPLLKCNKIIFETTQILNSKNNLSLLFPNPFLVFMLFNSIVSLSRYLTLTSIPNQDSGPFAYLERCDLHKYNIKKNNVCIISLVYYQILRGVFSYINNTNQDFNIYISNSSCIRLINDITISQISPKTFLIF